jgi:hypothetical protein
MATLEELAGHHHFMTPLSTRMVCAGCGKTAAEIFDDGTLRCSDERDTHREWIIANADSQPA